MGVEMEKAFGNLPIIKILRFMKEITWMIKKMDGVYINGRMDLIIKVVLKMI